MTYLFDNAELEKFATSDARLLKMTEGRKWHTTKSMQEWLETVKKLSDRGMVPAKSLQAFKDAEKTVDTLFDRSCGVEVVLYYRRRIKFTDLGAAVRDLLGTL